MNSLPYLPPLPYSATTGLWGPPVPDTLVIHQNNSYAQEPPCGRSVTGVLALKSTPSIDISFVPRGRLRREGIPSCPEYVIESNAGFVVPLYWKIT